VESSLYILNYDSIFQYFEVRYGSVAVKKLAACFFMLYLAAYMGVALYAPVVALSSMTGFPQWAAILLAGGVCTVYSSIVSIT
jgi:Na+/proline symporter